MKNQALGWTIANINSSVNSFTAPMDMRQSITEIEKLPVLPEMASRIISLMNDPLSNAKKLADVISLDPILSAQVIRWANSPLYGYKGKIQSVQDAISLVLGYDFVLNLALGLAAMKPLNLPEDGPIGSRRQWQHSLASSRLMAQINQRLPSALRLADDQVQLAALLHNLGFLLLGEQFQDEFHYLNRLIVANPGLAIIRIEDFALSVNHTLLGSWLMQSWSFPKAIINVVFHHHNPHYRGDDYILNLVTFLNDCILGQLHIGDGMVQPCPPEVFEELNLSANDAQALLAEMQEQVPAINATRDSLFAG